MRGRMDGKPTKSSVASGGSHSSLSSNSEVSTVGESKKRDRA